MLQFVKRLIEIDKVSLWSLFYLYNKTEKGIVLENKSEAKIE